MFTRSPRFIAQLIGILALLAGSCGNATAGDGGETQAQSPLPQRPRIGLVLAGGGAKGGAHVGVLKVLEQMHVPIDCIAGTSMGALAGGGYASGIPADKLQSFLEGINWKRVVGGVGRRGLEPIEQKRQGATYSNQLQLGIKDSRIVIAPGLVDSSSIDDLLRGFVGKAREQPDFNRLPIPFRAVATDMVSGQMVVLDHGDLSTAMRASMALPGVFAPVDRDKQILADGGLVRNLPVDVARGLCADVVIVVNLVSPPANPDDLRAPGQLLGRTMELMIEANEQLQLKSLTARDVLISVPMGDIGVGDFERITETVALGAAAARRAAPELERYAVSPEEYLVWRNRVTSEQGIDSKVDTIEFAKLKRVNPQYLNQLADIKPGDRVTTQSLSQSAERMGAVEDIDSVGYELSGDPAHATLQWLPYEKSWAPDFIKVDLGMYSSTANDDRSFVLYIQHNRTWINSLGAEWRNEIQLGTSQILSTSFYQPLDVAQRVFVEPKLFWHQDWENVFYDSNDIARYRFGDQGGRFDLGVNLGNVAQLRVGYLATDRRVELETGSPLLPQLDTRDAGIAASAVYDTRDTPFNATRGVVASLEYYKSDAALGAQRDWQRAEAGAGIAIPYRNNILRLAAAGGSNLGSHLPADRLFTLGGPVSLPGEELDALRLAGYWTASASYLWQIKDIFTLRGQALYAGLRLQDLHVYESVDGTHAGQIGSLSLFITGRTPVGPVMLGFAETTDNAHTIWISFGRPIAEGTILSRGIFR